MIIQFDIKFQENVSDENIRNLHVDKIHLSNGKAKKLKINHDLFLDTLVERPIERKLNRYEISVSIRETEQIKKYIAEMICGNASIDLFLLKYPKFDTFGEIECVKFDLKSEVILLLKNENREFNFHN